MFQLDMDALDVLAGEEDDPEEQELTAEDPFFGFKSSRNQPPVDGAESAKEEVERYLASPTLSPSHAVQYCYAKGDDGSGQVIRRFPRLSELVLKYNTALPSSAAVERLFSKAGCSFTQLRNRLGDASLEIEILLRVNKKFWQ